LPPHLLYIQFGDTKYLLHLDYACAFPQN